MKLNTPYHKGLYTYYANSITRLGIEFFVIYENDIPVTTCFSEREILNRLYRLVYRQSRKTEQPSRVIDYSKF